MEHKGTQNIKADRLLLRKFKLDDATMMFLGWANDPQVTKFLSWEPHGSIDVTKEVIRSWREEYDQQNFYHWAILWDNSLIGSIGLLNPDDLACQAEAGYCMSRAYWGRGIMPQALSAVIQYAFLEVGFCRIAAKHNIENPNSGKVMRKCGMKFIERAERPLALKPDKVVMCDCYAIESPFQGK